ncbi:MAG: hypothetical protein IJ644_09625 [Oscillospiraceae bacterium]|nr:hypothetical protein [Oscillospiraceae bacterium]
MNSQTKFLISMLFIVVILLCVVLTRFYFDVTKNTESSVRENRVDSVSRKFGELQAFRSVNGSYGLLDADQSVLIEPEWLEILDVTDNLVLVSGKLENQVLIGGIDYEENVILPFVFRSMETLPNGWHLAEISDDGRYIVYNRKYQPVFRESFTSVSYEDNILTLGNETESLDYDTAEQPPLLRRAEFSCPVAETLTLNWKIANQFYLSELTASDLRRINQIVPAYMEMLTENNFRNLGEVTSSEYFSTLVKNSRLQELEFDSIGDFAFSRRESGAYDFTFRMISHPSSAPEEKIQIHLYFRKNAENQMILTASELGSAAEE